MGQNSVLAPSKAFILALRSALNHLYDPDNLRQNRLAVIFGVDQRFDTPSALQNILTKGIEALKPRPGAPNRAHAQSIYDLLLYRYVQQVNQEEIAGQLGISVRHLRRQQNLAMYELAYKLWEQYDLANQPGIEVSDNTTQAAAPPEAGASTTASPGADDSELTQELNWLKDSTLSVQTDLAIAMPDALELIRPMLTQSRTQMSTPAELSGLLVVHPVAFQQILLSLLSFAVKVCSGSQLRLKVLAHPEEQEIRVSGSRSPGVTISKEEEQQWLETLRQLATLSQGSFTGEITEDAFQTAVRFRSIEPVPLLVIDDNADIIAIMQRFTTETRYRVIGCSDPRQAVEQALLRHPKLIVLDIMMPQIDGLQVLSRLKHHPELGSIPVVICSVLPHKDLAASLGASGFIAKPFQREAFLAVLDAVHGQGK